LQIIHTVSIDKKKLLGLMRPHDGPLYTQAIA